MQTRYLAGVSLALLLGLSGCGGGGSSLPSLSNANNGTHTPVVSSTPTPSGSSTSPPGAHANASNKSTERSVAQGSLAYVRDLSLQTQVHHESTLSTMQRVLSLRKRVVTTAAIRPQDFMIACTNGTTED